MARPISSAEQFFRDITESPNPAGYLRRLVTDPPSDYENDWRDFKGGEHLDDSDAKRLWSKAQSGFAITGGGGLTQGDKQ